MPESSVDLRKGLRGLGLWLAAGLVFSVLIVSGTIEKVRPSPRTLWVKGYAELPVRADMASWSTWLTCRGTHLAETYAILNSQQQIVETFLQTSGCSKAEIRWTPVNVTTYYRRTDKGIATSEVEGYSLLQTVQVESADVERVERLAVASSRLIEQGIEINSAPPAYFVSTLDSHKIELLGAATRNALERANQLATNSQSRVGRLCSANQGVFQITPRHSTETSDSGTYDTGSIDKTIKAVVTVEFALEP